VFMLRSSRRQEGSFLVCPTCGDRAVSLRVNGIVAVVHVDKCCVLPAARLLSLASPTHVQRFPQGVLPV